MAGGGIVQLWTDSGIQIVVLLSFTFQLVLFLFAGIRRRTASSLLNLLLWLVYLLADSTAFYALGHLSVTTSHQLVAFWAPLLLVHLGGPDTITAYAIEDTRLWLRHLLTLVVQTLGASYVIYKYVATSTSTGRPLLAASVLMFTVGVLKYGERTWALRCGSMDGIKTTFPPLTEDLDDDGSSFPKEAFYREAKHVRLLNQKSDNKDEELLILAHLQLGRTCLQPFAGLECGVAVANTPHQLDDMYSLIQMQLSLMYDIIYTKAWVIHTWYGYCIRAVSLVATITSMLLFSLSNKNGYSRVDVDITYFLLAGAVALEIISVLTTIGSTWMCARLWSYKRAPIMLVNVLKSLHRRVDPPSKRRWSRSIWQYNLLHVCTRDSNELASRATKKMGLDKWWTRVHFVYTADISKTALPRLLLETLPDLDPQCSRGIQILERSGLVKEQAGWSHWSLNLKFAQSILIWHLATDMYLVKSKPVGHQGDVAQAVKMLSNYMMFLLVTKPDMLPGYIEEYLHDERHETCRSLEERWSKCRPTMEMERSPNKWWGKQFYNDGPDASRIQQIERLIGLIYENHHNTDYEAERVPGSATYPGYNDAKRLAAELLHLEPRKPELLKVILGVWLEMLCYAAQRCGPESHASQLSRAGELIPVVWLLTVRYRLFNHFLLP